MCAEELIPCKQELRKEERIQTELNELAEEKSWLEKTLGSKRRMRTLIRGEIEHDIEKYGDGPGDRDVFLGSTSSA